ncbi:DUF1349 domain-containing protein [Streptococcus entericus]|uniref:DUF1349 domain-containing protein n=1 Tax=Streptococcus entericus TaxID=155680 RepID=UPI00036EE2F8|nr:DUF1349 domain-containing protein [Streptococcus entericus]
MDLTAFSWTREPENWAVKEGSLTLTTQPHTDLWQRTYYHFQNDNTPLFQMTTDDPFFSFTVTVDFKDSHHRFDQAGIVLYQDSENWLKASVEYENDDFQHLGSVVTNGGYSDWATAEFPTTTKQVVYRLSRRQDDFKIEYSLDGVRFHQMRICHMAAASKQVSFGVYACSPEDSRFTARFSNFQLTDCLWQAHDGQQPD